MLLAAAPLRAAEGCKAVLLFVLLLTGSVQHARLRDAAQHSHGPGGTWLLLV
ncbi:hypothetical protein [Streptomyces sp. NPDC006463]|uniref:hypothetical protein n=1 Tax=Streptomyces sp. NPDC006463 TaxID=3364746 RepID=UPI00369D2ED5